jgi:hypothetical protein
LFPFCSIEGQHDDVETLRLLFVGGMSFGGIANVAFHCLSFQRIQCMSTQAMTEIGLMGDDLSCISSIIACQTGVVPNLSRLLSMMFVQKSKVD